jgi:hypothetical protein
MKNTNPQNKAKVKAYMIAYRRSHRSELNASARAWCRANPELDRERRRRYARTHRADVTRRVRRWQLRQDPANFAAKQAQYRRNGKARKLLAASQESTAPPAR